MHVKNNSYLPIEFLFLWCYNILMRKTVSLKNGLSATLIINNVENAYFVHAYDDKKNVVGKALFNIKYEFFRYLSEEERKRYATSHKIPLAQAPTKIKTKADGIEKYFFEQQSILNCKSLKSDKDMPAEQPPAVASKISEDGKVLTLENGKQFMLENTFCELVQIEIFHEKFYNVGLGQQMHEAVERISKEHNCSEIRALCVPHGDFMFGTIAFYKRNNYEFIKEFGMTCAIKSLNEKILEPATKSC